ncbi:MAG: hypothetical protein ACI8RZ_000532 [Myxococcota bacterium]|jgi:hypothetical protein
MSYYKQIDGMNYDRALVEAAEKAIAGRGDGRISKADAETLLPLLTDGGRFTPTEQATLLYLRENMKWTDKADTWLRAAMERWLAGDRTPAPARAAPTQSAPQGESAVILRVGTSEYFPHHLADQAPDRAVVILSNVPGSTQVTALWERTRTHNPTDLEKSVELELVNSGSDAVRANLWAFERVLGSHKGQVSWQSGFTNLPATTLIAELEGLGFRIIEATTIL